MKKLALSLLEWILFSYIYYGIRFEIGGTSLKEHGKYEFPANFVQKWGFFDVLGRIGAFWGRFEE